MRYLTQLGLGVLALANSMTAQQALVATSAPRYLLDELDVTAATIQDFELPAERQTFRMPIRLGTSTATLELWPTDVRSADYQLLVDTGTELIPMPRSAPVTWKGRVLGHGDSLVAASIVDGQFDGMVTVDDVTWGITPVHGIDPLRSVSQHLVYSAADRAPSDVKCGVEGGLHVHKTGTKPPAAGIEALRLCEIAADADFDFYNRFGQNLGAVENRITSDVNAVEAIYERDAEIVYDLTRIIVRTSSRYSWSGSMSNLLSQFATRWINSHAGVRRDVTHLWTGKGQLSGVIGIARLGAICSMTNGYGVSKAYYTSTTFNVGLLSHELGHNWAAGHCDSNGTCNIMCSNLNGCNSNLTRFVQASRNVIVSFKNSRTCLTIAPVAPTLSSVSPNTVEAYEPAVVTLNGANLLDVTSINVGSQTIGTFLSQSDASIRFQPPEPTQLGTTSISVTNAAATSNTRQFNYTATSPARMDAPPVWLSGIPMNFTFGGDANDNYFILLSFDGLSFQFAGFDVLTNHFVINQGTLSNVGLGSYALPIPNRPLRGLRLWTQLVGIDELTLQINDVTAPFLTSFF